jgi:hypothetical protein
LGIDLTSSRLQGPSVEIVVDKAPYVRTWILPKALLRYHSIFFSSRFKSPFNAARIELPEVDASVFEHFVRWIYSASLPDFCNLHMCEDTDLWILGDKLRAPYFKDAVMRELYRSYTSTDEDAKRFLACEVEWLWEDTAPHESLLMGFVVDVVAWRWLLEEPDDNDYTWDALILRYPLLNRELVWAMSGMCAGSTGTPIVTSLEAYLEAGDEEE